MTRRRTDDRHRGDSRGLARRRSNPDAERPLTPSDPSGKPNGHTFWFGAELAPDGNQSVVPDHFEGRPPDEGADARRGPAATAWSTLAWMPPDHPLDPDQNRFQVWVSDDGDTRIERYGD